MHFFSFLNVKLKISKFRLWLKKSIIIWSVSKTTGGNMCRSSKKRLKFSPLKCFLSCLCYSLYIIQGLFSSLNTIRTLFVTHYTFLNKCKYTSWHTISKRKLHDYFQNDKPFFIRCNCDLLPRRQRPD